VIEALILQQFAHRRGGRFCVLLSRMKLNTSVCRRCGGGIRYAPGSAMEFAELMRRRTFAFALAVVQLCRTLPYTAESDVFRGQLLRSGTSVGANYRASCRSRSPREKGSKLGIALEEADESEYWLSLLDRLDIGAVERRHALLKECGELVAIFARSLHTHRQTYGSRPKPRPPLRDRLQVSDD
jgi:four helix bundle protein